MEYSVCPSVYEIQVLWNNHQTIPDNIDSYFKYTKTHSKVTFHKMQQYSNVMNNLYSNINTKTESKIMYIIYILLY